MDSLHVGGVLPVSKAPAVPSSVDRSLERPCPTMESVSGSYFEIEVGRGIVTVYERMGDGQTELLVKMLGELGLDMIVRVSSPCG